MTTFCRKKSVGLSEKKKIWGGACVPRISVLDSLMCVALLSQENPFWIICAPGLGASQGVLPLESGRALALHLAPHLALHLALRLCVQGRYNHPHAVGAHVSMHAVISSQL